MRYDTGINVSLSDYNGQIILVSFIEIDNGWDWFKHLVYMHNDPALAGILANIQILPVIFQHLGSVSEFTVGAKVSGLIAGDPAISSIPFPVLMDNSWLNSIALQYADGIILDPYFSSSPGNSLWSYMISKDYIFTDKWHSGGTAAGNPISFNRMDLSPLPSFDSSDYVNTQNYVTQRLLNLNADPKIHSANPEDNSYINTAPTTVEIVFSKPLESVQAGTAANYTLGGSGISAGSITAVDFTGANMIENVVELTLTGVTLNDTAGVEDPVTITVNNTNIQDTESNALAGDNIINYTTDLTTPRILSVETDV